MNNERSVRQRAHNKKKKSQANIQNEQLKWAEEKLQKNKELRIWG